jgi:sialic acid synthase SpsE
MKNFIQRIVEHEPYIMAEAGINHNGDIKLAREMISAAHQAGAHCIKFQSFMTDKYISKKAGRAAYQNQEAVGERSQYEIIKACETTKEEMQGLFEYAKKLGIDFLEINIEKIE